MNTQRRYHVSGIDDLGDVHTFSTDDRQRAEEIVAIMREDLEDVELVERAQPGFSTLEGVLYTQNPAGADEN